MSAFIFFNKDQSLWTNNAYVGVVNYPTWNGKEVIQAGRTLSTLRLILENQQLPIQYDHVFGIFE